MGDSAGSAFPPGFLWGCATAAYQVEGSTEADGRSPSVWDAFCRKPGAVLGGMNGDLACDSYRRWDEDVALLRGLGVDSYRFSLSWPRILPEGGGRPNRAGLDHYRRCCESLLAAGIEPFACLYHWDHPQVLEEAGGWPSRDMAGRFADYAALCFRELGDLVGRWMTLNEPWCSSILSYLHGLHAPGLRDAGLAYRAVHHLLLGHGLAVEAFRSLAPRGPGAIPGAPGALRPDGRGAAPAPTIGLALNPSLPRPATRRGEDRLAAVLASEERTALFMDPLFGRGYPERHLATVPGARMPVEAGDLEAIARPVDWIGVNYYNEDCVEAVSADAAHPGGFRQVPTAREKTEMGWDIVPDGLGRLLSFLAGNWPVPLLLVTENGGAFPDRREADGTIHDRDRIAYLRDHVAAARAALEAGVPLGGYWAWSLLDNFEWSHGYSKRFGLVHVDFATGKRTPKDSYLWYRDLLAAGGALPR